LINQNKTSEVYILPTLTIRLFTTILFETFARS